MKKTFLISILAALCVAAVGCGKSGGDGGSASSTPASDPNAQIEGTWITTTVTSTNVPEYLAVKISSSQLAICGVSVSTPNTLLGKSDGIPYSYAAPTISITLKDPSGQDHNVQFNYNSANNSIVSPTGAVFLPISADNLALVNKAGCNF